VSSMYDATENTTRSTKASYCMQPTLRSRSTPEYSSTPYSVLRVLRVYSEYIYIVGQRTQRKTKALVTNNCICSSAHHIMSTVSIIYTLKKSRSGCTGCFGDPRLTTRLVWRPMTTGQETEPNSRELSWNTTVPSG
jgi:hypothetical protein